ncbi:hypothetical protein IWX50DRAFT_613983 [Phyllosticta citricarpa]|uniref:Uncharacterized protein n=1 Tax=Phyllosticta citricarpa TaxID=55181 RepID=A0ABR1MNQ5_9PEZI
MRTFFQRRLSSFPLVTTPAPAVQCISLAPVLSKSLLPRSVFPFSFRQPVEESPATFPLQVHPDEACLGDIALEAIGPAVVLAAEDAGLSGLRLHDGVCSVSTNGEAVDVVLAVLNQKEGKVGVHN